MSRKLFRLVDVWSGCWVVRDARAWRTTQQTLQTPTSRNNPRDMQQHSFNKSF
jgi:hypothetical protein